MDKQVNAGTRGYGEMYDIDVYDKFSRGLSHEFLKKLPHHVISKESETRQIDCCSICLQVWFLLPFTFQIFSGNVKLKIWLSI